MWTKNLPISATSSRVACLTVVSSRSPMAPHARRGPASWPGRGPRGDQGDGAVVLPATVFSIPAEQLVEEIKGRRSRR